MRIAPYLLAAAASLALANAFAQGYPNRPIKVVVPWPPGQATDVAARIVSEGVSSTIGQQLVIDNRAGAGGTIGSEFAARAAADGYTILAGSSGPISISPLLQKLPYDPAKDFEPIALMVSTPYVLVVHPSLQAATVQEFVTLVRANPGKFNFASSGTGATAHLVAELFNAAASLQATHVPYKGSAPALTDLIAGHVTYSFETSAAVLPHVKAGRLKALGVSSGKRAIALPEVPTVTEALGFANFDMRAWIGFIAPAGIPREARTRLAAEVQRALDSPETKARLIAAGLEPGDLTPEQFAEFLKVQSERFGGIIRQANIKVQ
jgi:tripartite-type tricarboxylate transporter receptor subunit TctC